MIDLSTMDADVNIARNQAFVFVGNAGITDFAQVGFRTVGGYTVIPVGANTPAPLVIIRVDGGFALTAVEFVL